MRKNIKGEKFKWIKCQQGGKHLQRVKDLFNF